MKKKHRENKAAQRARKHTLGIVEVEQKIEDLQRWKMAPNEPITLDDRNKGLEDKAKKILDDAAEAAAKSRYKS